MFFSLSLCGFYPSKSHFPATCTCPKRSRTANTAAVCGATPPPHPRDRREVLLEPCHVAAAAAAERHDDAGRGSAVVPAVRGRRPRRRAVRILGRGGRLRKARLRQRQPDDRRARRGAGQRHEDQAHVQSGVARNRVLQEQRAREEHRLRGPRIHRSESNSNLLPPQEKFTRAHLCVFLFFRSSRVFFRVPFKIVVFGQEETEKKN